MAPKRHRAAKASKAPKVKKDKPPTKPKPPSRPRQTQPKKSRKKAKPAEENPWDEPPPAGQLSLVANNRGSILLGPPPAGQDDQQPLEGLAPSQPGRGSGRGRGMKRPAALMKRPAAADADAGQMPAADAGAQDCEDDALSTATTLLLDGSKRPSTRHAESGEQDHHLPPSQSSVTMADMEDDADTYIFSHVPSRAGAAEAATAGASDGSPAMAGGPDVTNFDSMWAHSRRNMQRLLLHFGEEAVQNLVRNISRTSVISLYSGLGGAELATLTNYVAAVELCKQQGWELPEKPRMLLACDFEPNCQKVLMQHQDSPIFVVPDLKNFVKDEYLKKAEEIQAEVCSRAQTKQAKMTVAEKEKIGLQFVETVVDMFVKNNALNQSILCLNGKSVPLRLLMTYADEDDSLLCLIAGSICKDFSSMGDGNRLVGRNAILFCIMVTLVRVLRPQVFLHECTRLFPGKAYFGALLPSYKVHHSSVDPRTHGCPARRSRVYDGCIRSDFELVGDAMDSFRRLYASGTLDVSVFMQAQADEVDEMKKHMAKIAFKASSCSFQELLPPTAKVNLDAVRGMEKIKEKLKVQTEIAVNLDQDPHVQEHMGSDMPVLLASLSTMYALLRDRPFTALELGAAQLVPTYKRCWEALGFASAPIDFTGVPFHAVRKMSGNTFHQGCFVAWQAFVLMKLRKK